MLAENYLKPYTIVYGFNLDGTGKTIWGCVNHELSKTWRDQGLLLPEKNIQTLGESKCHSFQTLNIMGSTIH